MKVRLSKNHFIKGSIYRLSNYYGSLYGEDTDICTLGRTLLVGMVSVFTVIIVGAFLGIALALPVIEGILLVSGHYHGPVINTTWTHVGIIAWFIGLAIALSIVLNKVIAQAPLTRREKKHYKRLKREERIQAYCTQGTGSLSISEFIIVYYRLFKEKTCVRVEWADEQSSEG